MVRAKMEETPIADPEDVRTIEEIGEELEQKYPRLAADKQSPIMFFDTCLHTGSSINPIITVMNMLGFENIQIGLVENVQNESGRTPDFIALPNGSRTGCYPFGHENLVNKNFKYVHGVPSIDSSKIAAGKDMRRRIRNAFRNNSI